MSLKIRINDLASRKMVGHALKNMTEDVYGVVVGTVSGNDVKVTDAYPLFHSKFLTPILETAFEFVEAIAKANGEVIVGWYEGNVKNTDNNEDLVTEVSHDVVENMAKSTTFPLLFSIKEITKESSEESNGIEIRALLGRRGNADYGFQNISASLDRKFDIGVLDVDLKTQAHLQLVDFQSHLVNPELDFCNKFFK